MGVAMRVRGASGRPNDAVTANTCWTIARSESMTPFGRPVVPPVYCSRAIASSSTVAERQRLRLEAIAQLQQVRADIRRAEGQQMLDRLCAGRDLLPALRQRVVHDQHLDLCVIAQVDVIVDRSHRLRAGEPRADEVAGGLQQPHFGHVDAQRRHRAALRAALVFSTLRIRLVLSAASA